MALEDPNNIEKTPPAAAQEPAVEAEHGAVKKKIEIPGVGEIEYTEKRVMFPEKIVQETGGVKGYVRKMISWEELLRFWDIDEIDLEKIKAGEKVSSKNFRKANGINDVVSTLTNHELINQTLNHVVYRGEGGWEKNEEEFLSKKGALNKLEIRRDSIPYDVESDEVLPNHEFLKRTGISKNLFKKYNEGLLSDEEQEIFEAKLKNTKNTYFQSNSGLNLTNVGRLWSGYSFHGEYDPRGLKLSYIALGFKLDTHNAVLRDYCVKIAKLIKAQDTKEADSDIKFNKRNRYENSEFRALAETTLKALINPIKHFKDKKRGIADKWIGGSQDQGSHPCLPIVINHPDIPELRWCHADYAAIPTKNGYNILEMIT